jgi:enoyl-CoA hydratase/carnithine racemase
MTGSDEVLVTRDGAVVTLTFNRPQARNAMTWNMYERLHETCEQVDADAGVRVLVLRGAGNAFVAGTDITQFAAFTTGEDGLRYEQELDRYIERLERVRIPVIAQIHGPCVGGGFMIATACDLRVASPDAKFGAPIARTLGNCLSMAAHSRFVDALGPTKVKELIFTARLLSAADALAAGYVAEVVAADGLEARVRELARTMCEHAPITMAVTKEFVRRIAEHRRGHLGGDDLVVKTYGSNDFHEGARAFVEKRKPNWTGT